ncbi:toprim domain-containing protein [Nitrolancea hollandica]|uniref:Toprim domain-containing protein n=1 Tax=Nitrolancea hollandica Lb TaxID=1129897 RepID=I4EFL5_9BACT|nr:toprim domain-containing protein [Nitrolancea hollandica]CCF83477.1 hypothetical protein NITHO_2310020 [Nitrolancea hollandica Lb]
MGKVVEVIDLRLTVGRPSSSSPILVPCPFHDDDRPSLAIYQDHTFCYGCRTRETLDQYLARIGANVDQLKHDSFVFGAQAIIQEPPFDPKRHRSSVEIWRRTLAVGPRKPRLDWLQDRGLWPSTVERAGIGHTGERFSIPIWGWKEGERNKLYGCHFRADPKYCDPDAPKYTNIRGQKVLVYRPNPGARPLVVCEGPLDALLLAQMGVDAVTTTGGAGSLPVVLTSEALGWTGRIYLATDQDIEGDKAAALLQEKFGKRIYRMRWRQGKDITDALLQLDVMERRKTLTAWIEEAA